MTTTNNIPTFEMYNGNDKLYTISLPRIQIVSKELQEHFIQRVYKQTGLSFVKDPNGFTYSAQPESFDQFMKLFLTSNFKTRYYNNGSTENTLMLKFDHNNGYDVNSICKECVIHNHIHVGNLEDGDRLAC